MNNERKPLTITKESHGTFVMQGNYCVAKVVASDGESIISDVQIDARDLHDLLKELDELKERNKEIESKWDADILSFSKERKNLSQSVDTIFKTLTERNQQVKDLQSLNAELLQSVIEFVSGFENNFPEYCKGSTFTKAKSLIAKAEKS